MTAERSKPKTKEEWDEFWAKNKELSNKLRQAGKTYMDLDDMEFKNSLVDLTQEQLKVMMKSMRASLEFYKKILKEPYYVENPHKKKTHRYEDAMKKYNSVNSKGKIVHSLINNH